MFALDLGDLEVIPLIKHGLVMNLMPETLSLRAEDVLTFSLKPVTCAHFNEMSVFKTNNELLIFKGFFSFFFFKGSKFDSF